MLVIEFVLREQLTEVILVEVSEGQPIRSEDLCEWHRRRLGNVYEWVGYERD